LAGQREEPNKVLGPGPINMRRQFPQGSKARTKSMGMKCVSRLREVGSKQTGDKGDAARLRIRRVCRANTELDAHAGIADTRSPFLSLICLLFSFLGLLNAWLRAMNLL